MHINSYNNSGSAIASFSGYSIPQNRVIQSEKLNIFEGDLWEGSEILRTEYCRTFREIKTVAQFKATLRNGSHTDLGGYPMFFITSDGGALSFESAIENYSEIIDSIKNDHSDGWRIVACDINYEDSDLSCCHSGDKIESAYN